jgi:hypothetical protein
VIYLDVEDLLYIGERAVIPTSATLREQSFFEAYFSNFIEGTEFTLDEAVHLIYDGRVPVARPADAHDVTSTYELISDATDAEREGKHLLMPADLAAATETSPAGGN